MGAAHPAAEWARTPNGETPQHPERFSSEPARPPGGPPRPSYPSAAEPSADVPGLREAPGALREGA
eukprot:2937630-Pyramimonas_sp.AAC.1